MRLTVLTKAGLKLRKRLDMAISHHAGATIEEIHAHAAAWVKRHNYTLAEIKPFDPTSDDIKLELICTVITAVPRPKTLAAAA